MSLNSGFINSTIICNEKKDVDLDALNLLASGETVALCQCSYKNESKHHHFIYNTDDLMPLTQLQAGLSFENVIDILSAASKMIQELTESNLCLDNVKNAAEYVFKADTDYKFVYIPIIQKPRLSMRDYLIKLVSVVHHKDVRLSQFIKELRKKKNNEQALAYLNAFVASYGSQYNFSDEDTSLLSDEGATSLLGDEGATSLLGIEAKATENETSLLPNDGNAAVLSQANYNDVYDAANTGPGSAKLTEYFLDETGEYETTVLTHQPVFPSQPVYREIESEYYLYLTRNLNGEKITIDMTPFTIGKDINNMDFVLNNDSVSRHHATIIYEDGNYFIMDNHSTNGTMIEGIKLQAGEKGEIGNGYIISLGNESFQAHIERR